MLVERILERNEHAESEMLTQERRTAGNRAAIYLSKPHTGPHGEERLLSSL